MILPPAPARWVTPHRGDFLAVDAALSELKLALNHRSLSRLDAKWVEHFHRHEMRYHAKLAVQAARIYRAARSS